MKLYGATWNTNDPFLIELECIRNGGRWKNQAKEDCGAGLMFHYKRLQTLIAPWKKWDRWSEFLLKNFIRNKFTVVAGPANSTKTHNLAFFGLCEYLLYPECTTVLMTSTDARSLELRCWGEFKKLWGECKSRWDDCPGRLIESRQMLVTDIAYSDATDFRNGVIGIPCMIGGTFVGLGKFVGVKNLRIRLLADELSFMSLAFFDSIANLSKNKGFKGIGTGNPKDRTDTFGRLAEPSSEIGGWEGVPDEPKTRSWPTRFQGGMAICLDGRDTPNNDPPGNLWPYIITKENIQNDINLYGSDSVQVAMMDYGVFPRDAQARRVITRTICEKGKAMEEVTWSSTPKRIVGLDAAYGAIGGDRCVMVDLEFGMCVDGTNRIAFKRPPMVVPVSDRNPDPPEDQIAGFVRDYCVSEDIPPGNMGFDSTGRGTLVSAFARRWSSSVTCIEFGGAASERMVSAKIQTSCRKYYANFMTELWYQFRYAIEADQIRQLPTDVMDEGCLRGWDWAGKRIQVEPKEFMKVRTGRSSDVFDAAVCGLEIARRQGFIIAGIRSPSTGNGTPKWLKDLADKSRKMLSTHELTYSRH